MRRFSASVMLFLLLVVGGTAEVQAGGKGWNYQLPAGRPIRPRVLPYDDQMKAVICTNRPVPPNWIIVGIQNSPACNGLGKNAWVIQRLPNYPGADMIICGNQPIPPGWAAVESVRTVYCGHGVNGIRIRKM